MRETAGGGASGTAGAGVVTVLFSKDISGPWAIAVDATHVYWVQREEIMRAALAGGTPVLLASGQAQPHAIAVDDARICWTNLGGAVLSLPKP